MIPVTGSVVGGRLSTESDAEMRARLVESLTQSFPGSALSRALNACKDEPAEDFDEMDPLSLSCFAEIRLDKVKVEEDSDDDLTSLEWLQDADLIKTIRCDDGALTPEEGEERQVPFGQPHPHNIPYNPQKHINSKPPYSFSCLIFMAIEESPDRRLPVKDIYNWIVTHFPYFQHAPTGWKNSVRHNLSLNKCFRKVDKDRGSSIGKGSLWMVDPDFRPNLLQALRRTPYAPYHQMQMLAQPQLSTNYSLLPGLKPAPGSPGLSLNTPSPHLFPFLSRRIAQANGGIKVEDPLDVSDIDIANTLMQLKNNSRSRTQTRGGSDDDDRPSRSPSPPEFGSRREKEQIKQRKEQIRAEWRRKHPGPATLFAVPYPDHAYVITDLARVPGYEPDSPDSCVDNAFDFGGPCGSDVSDVNEDSDNDTKRVADDVPEEENDRVVDSMEEDEEEEEEDTPVDPNVRTSRRLQEKKRRKDKGSSRDNMFVMLPLKKTRRVSKDTSKDANASGAKRKRSMSCDTKRKQPRDLHARKSIASRRLGNKPSTRRVPVRPVDNVRRLEELNRRLTQKKTDEDEECHDDDDDLADGAQALLNLARLAVPLLENNKHTDNNNDSANCNEGDRKGV